MSSICQLSRPATSNTSRADPGLTVGRNCGTGQGELAGRRPTGHGRGRQIGGAAERETDQAPGGLHDEPHLQVPVVPSAWAKNRKYGIESSMQNGGETATPPPLMVSE